jgi:NAD(P)H-dependent flavin oxidoreductase YrpB (nitropropane dioxygenase family)
MLDAELPVVVAPMSGGATTPRLAAAAARAGAFSFLAGGYKTAEQLAAQIAEVRNELPTFGVNLFAPSPVPIEPADFRRYAEQLQPDAARYGLDLSGAPLRDDDDWWSDKLDLLLADPVAVVSTTFGLPRRQDIAALRKAGSMVLLTVTTVEEAQAAAEAGADGLVAQGIEAGGHRGTHTPASMSGQLSTAELTGAVMAATGLPTVAAGGVDGPESLAALLRAGAMAVAVGTLLLRTDESGASPTYQDALADPAFTRTTVTRAFTGRPARGLHNAFIERHEPHAPLGYPAVHHLTWELRQAAAAAGQPHDLHLWAGTGYRNARTGPAADVITSLAAHL